MFCLKILSACTFRFYCLLHRPRLYWSIYCLLSRSVHTYYCLDIRWYCLLVLFAFTVRLYCLNVQLFRFTVRLCCSDTLSKSIACFYHFYCPHVALSWRTVCLCTTRFYNLPILSTCKTVQLVVLACNCLRVMYTCTAGLYCSLLLSACTVRMYHCPDIQSCLYCSLVQYRPKNLRGSENLYRNFK